jgi:hypothetical protein
MNQAQAGGYLPPRLSMDANAVGSSTVGQADLMLSLEGDEQHNFYFDPQAAYGTDEQWYADLGLGYRWIENDAAILGWYVFASRTHVENQAGFWIANPGVEAMGSRWDSRINGYIPVAGRSDELGVFPFIQSSQLVFTGHTESLLTTYVNGNETQQIGNGIDARVSYQVFRDLPLKAYLGAYFFDIPHTDNVRDGAAGLEYWFDQHVKIFANYTYDNWQHSTVVGGLAVSFGGIREQMANPSLSERLSDPVQRYLANLGHGSGIPSETLLTNLQTGAEGVLNTASIDNLLSNSNSSSSGGEESESELIDNDVAYFSQTGTPNNGGVGLTLANCTFANPCGPSDFSQTGVNTLNSLLPNTVMFFNGGGSYSALDATGSNPMTLNTGQGIFGRTSNDSGPASGAARPIFNGAFILTGNNTLDSIILNNTNTLGTTSAITSTGGQNILINNTNIGSAAIPYRSAINLINAMATLTQSNLTVSYTGVFLSASSLLVQSSNISVLGDANLTSLGFRVLTNSNLTLSNSQLNVNNTSPTSVNAMLVAADSTALINGSSIVLTNSYPGQTAFALRATNTGTIEMNNGSLSVSGNSFSGFIQGGPNIVLKDVSCRLNGTAVSC